MKKRGLGTKGLVILLVAATVVFCAALRSISHSYYTSAATMHAEGTSLPLIPPKTWGRRI